MGFRKVFVLYLSALLFVLVPLVDHVLVGGLVLVELVLVLLGLGDRLRVGPGQLVALLRPGLVLPHEAAVHQTQRLARSPQHVLLLVPEFVHFILQRKSVNLRFYCKRVSYFKPGIDRKVLQFSQFFSPVFVFPEILF